MTHELCRQACCNLRSASKRRRVRLQKCLMIALPNSEHFSFVAPSIMRWKSYVTVLAPIAPSRPLMIKSAASPQPRCRSIISPDKITEPGFTMSRFAYLGAVPCVASKIAWPVL